MAPAADGGEIAARTAMCWRVAVKLVRAGCARFPPLFAPVYCVARRIVIRTVTLSPLWCCCCHDGDVVAMLPVMRCYYPQLGVIVHVAVLLPLILGCYPRYDIVFPDEGCCLNVVLLHPTQCCHPQCGAATTHMVLLSALLVLPTFLTCSVILTLCWWYPHR